MGTADDMVDQAIDGITPYEAMGAMTGPVYVPPQKDVAQAIGQFAARGNPGTAHGDDQFAVDHANPAMQYQMGPSGGNMQPMYPAHGSPYDDRVIGRSDSDINQLNLNASRGGTDPNVAEQDDQGVARGIQLQKLRNQMQLSEPYGHWEGDKFVQDKVSPNSVEFGNTPQGKAMYDLMGRVVSGQATKAEKLKFIDTYLSQGV